MSLKKESISKPNKSHAKKRLAGEIKKNERTLWIGTSIIAIITFLAYLPVFSNGFVNMDDDRYITNQPIIHVISLKNCFTTFIEGNYHPLVMLMYSIMYHFFGIDPTSYHLLSLLLHIINSWLVLWLIFSLTDSFPIAFVASLLFGISPMHVESVAWASELKDLMYSMGFLCSLIYYVRYVKEQRPMRLYIISLLFFLFSLFSKGMGVSLTVVLFLIDFYLNRKATAKSIVEKIPFFILSLVFGITAIVAQKTSGSLEAVQFYPFPERILFACHSFLFYIVRLLVPLNLCTYNTYPVNTGEPVPVIYYISPFILLVLVAAVFYSLKKTRKVFFGIAFFIATIFLVLQLLPVGVAITAERYSYIPSIGIFYLMAEGLLYLSNKASPAAFPSRGLIALLCLYVLFFLFQTYNQVKVWKDSVTLWNRVVDNYQTTPQAYMFRGEAYTDKGELDKAMDDFGRSFKMDSKNALIWCNIGIVYWQKGLNDKSKGNELFPRALTYFNKAIEINPNLVVAICDRGGVYYSMNETENAINDFNHAIQLDPTFADTYYNRGIAYYNIGKSNEACADLKRAAYLGHEHANDAVRDLCK